jgi:predicted RNA binding protein YcfA (HicA-like mRNA interferase family)
MQLTKFKTTLIMPSDVSKRIVQLAKSYGFTLVRQKRHLIFKHSSGKILATSFTCSDRRALKNIESTIKQLLLKNDSSYQNKTSRSNNL